MVFFFSPWKVLPPFLPVQVLCLLHIVVLILYTLIFYFLFFIYGSYSSLGQFLSFFPINRRAPFFQRNFPFFRIYPKQRQRTSLGPTSPSFCYLGRGFFLPPCLLFLFPFEIRHPFFLPHIYFFNNFFFSLSDSPMPLSYDGLSAGLLVTFTYPSR